MGSNTISSKLMKDVNTAERCALHIITAAFLKEKSSDAVVWTTLSDKKYSEDKDYEIILQLLALIEETKVWTWAS